MFAKNQAVEARVKYPLLLYEADKQDNTYKPSNKQNKYRTQPAFKLAELEQPVTVTCKQCTSINTLGGPRDGGLWISGG